MITSPALGTLNSGIPDSFLSNFITEPFNKSFQLLSKFSPITTVPAPGTVDCVPTAPLTIPTNPSEFEIYEIRLCALPIFQEIPSRVAESRVKPPIPSIVRTTSLSTGFAMKTNLIPNSPRYLLLVTPLPLTKFLIESSTILLELNVKSGSPNSMLASLAMK